MKRYLIGIIGLVLVSVLFFSCSNGPENPYADVSFIFRIPVQRAETDGSDYLYHLDYENLGFEYKVYPVVKGNKDLHGTVREWTPTEIIKLSLVGSDTKSKNSFGFHLGYLTPGVWTVDMRFVDPDSGNVLFVGKVDSFEVLTDQVFDFSIEQGPNNDSQGANNVCVPVLNSSKGSGNILIQINTPISLIDSDSVSASQISLRYRYNCTQYDALSMPGYNTRYSIRYTDSYYSLFDGQSEILDADEEESVGTIIYNEDGKGCKIMFDNVPYGYYFIYLDVVYTDNNGDEYKWTSVDREKGALLVYHASSETETIINDVVFHRQ